MEQTLKLNPTAIVLSLIILVELLSIKELLAVGRGSG